jgi:hypothetical protein
MSEPGSFTGPNCSLPRMRKHPWVRALGTLALLAMVGGAWVMEWNWRDTMQFVARAQHVDETDADASDDHHADTDAHDESRGHSDADDEPHGHAGTGAESHADADVGDGHYADSDAGEESHGHPDAVVEPHADADAGDGHYADADVGEESHGHPDAGAEPHGNSDGDDESHADEQETHGEDHGHGTKAPPVSPFVKQIVLSAFAGVNGLVLLAAIVQRRRNPPKLPKHLRL